MIPIVFSLNCPPPFFCHRPFLRLTDVQNKFLDNISIKPSAISATDKAFTPPVQPIWTPCRSHAFRSILSNPTPYLAINLSFGQLLKTLSSTFSRPIIATSASDKNRTKFSPCSFAPRVLSTNLGNNSLTSEASAEFWENDADVQAILSLLDPILFQPPF